MEEKIYNQLQVVENSLSWIKSSLEGEKQTRAYRSLVNSRRQLKRKKLAIEGNPAAATYGESQVGKSYLLSALLSKKGEPFTIKDSTGKVYHFINDINPLGRGTESTSVVTRFSVKEEIVYDDFPIKAKLLSPADIIVLICEAYYNNLNAETPPSFERLKERVEQLTAMYDNGEYSNSFITEDDVLDIQDYFKDHFSKLLYNNINDVGFFEKISLIVEKIPVDQWKNVFSVLWNESPQLTNLYSDLVNQFGQIGFADTVYIPIEAVLRKHGTLLDVARLDEIYGPHKGEESQYKASTEILYLQKDKERQIQFPKSYLCALISELVFVLPEKITENKEFLEHTDLLDFPGSRRFEGTHESRITSDELTVLLRRGKVDYLFNKYSKNSRINTLLFCQNQKHSGVSVMPEKLEKWINNMIGANKHDREKFKTPVAPLFIISTWFNSDLEFNINTDKSGSTDELNSRWYRRFLKVLSDEVIKTNSFPWFNDWTVSSPNFQNIYLLRDFYQSSDKASQIFKGFNEYNEEKSEIRPPEYPNFRKDLRESFINYDFVKTHFKNPEESWDRAASLNEDGTNLIIDNLSVASSSINKARYEKTLSELREITEEIRQELRRYYHSENKDLELQKAKSIAGDIQFKMAMAFKGDDIALFGKMIKELMIDERTVFSEFRKKIDDIESRQIENKDKYSIIRMKVPELSPTLSKEENLEMLFKAFEKNSKEQQDLFLLELDNNQIDLDELFNASEDTVKSFSQQLAQNLVDYWLVYASKNDKYVVQQVLTEGALEEVLEMFRRLFEKLKITDVIAQKIRRYVDGYTKIEAAYEMIADFSAEIINRCIISVGTEFLSEPDLNDLKMANEENDLGLSFEDKSRTNGEVTKEEIADLFSKIDDMPQLLQGGSDALKTLPNFKNYHSWSNNLKIGFVSVCDIPSYDVQANEKLGNILSEIEAINY